MNTGDEIQVLDKGFVRLVAVLGNDDLIANAARVSYKFKSKQDNDKLIEYLIRNDHWSPFEMVEFIFMLKVPIFVARQIFRHRTASFNEISGRYVQMDEEFFIPSEFRTNKSANKQTSISEDVDYDFSLVEKSHQSSFDTYKQLLESGLARELARVVLPLGTYTMFYYKQDLRNLFNFLRLRLDEHAQKEIREVANAMKHFVATYVPSAWAAFEKHVLNSVRLSEEDLKYIDLTTLTIKKVPESKTYLEELKKKLEFLKTHE